MKNKRTIKQVNASLIKMMRYKQLCMGSIFFVLLYHIYPNISLTNGK